mmetsp:Transcript_12703/g.33770  ORF Transcript_12703/g.33770 Transcript_12703/m.33770 type:complete len:248 (+) Transcript_12703:1199-1942(+)
MWHSRAIASAVALLSPVTMRTTMPARWHRSTASGTPGRQGSLMPTSRRSVSPESGRSSSSPNVVPTGHGVYATQSVRSVPAAMSAIKLTRSSRRVSVSSLTEPSRSISLSHRPRIISLAPFQYTRTSPVALERTAVPARFFVLLNGTTLIFSTFSLAHSKLMPIITVPKRKIACSVGLPEITGSSSSYVLSVDEQLLTVPSALANRPSLTSSRRLLEMLQQSHRPFVSSGEGTSRIHAPSIARVTTI